MVAQLANDPFLILNNPSKFLCASGTSAIIFPQPNSLVNQKNDNKTPTINTNTCKTLVETEAMNPPVVAYSNMMVDIKMSMNR